MSILLTSRLAPRRKGGVPEHVFNITADIYNRDIYVMIVAAGGNPTEPCRVIINVSQDVHIWGNSGTDPAVNAIYLHQDTTVEMNLASGVHIVGRGGNGGAGAQYSSYGNGAPGMPGMPALDTDLPKSNFIINCNGAGIVIAGGGGGGAGGYYEGMAGGGGGRTSKYGTTFGGAGGSYGGSAGDAGGNGSVSISGYGGGIVNFYGVYIPGPAGVAIGPGGMGGQGFGGAGGGWGSAGGDAYGYPNNVPGGAAGPSNIDKVTVAGSYSPTVYG